jgi:hypothetical protein
MNPILVEIVVRHAIFLELADDEVLDPDTAVQQLEDLAFLLQKLGTDERRQFVQALKELGTSDEWSPRQREVLEQLPEAAGIA